ncbi:MAG: PAS domain S-box protein [Acidobacteriaceae bacterium]|nr:PAS domain S-box protein [Acidobacteriaceae bacterium]
MRRTKALIACALVTILISVADWLFPDLSFGFLYLGPLLVSAIFLSRAQVAICAVVAAVLTQSFGPFKAWPDTLLRFSVTLVIFLGAALFVAEIMRRKRVEADYATKLKEASARRREAEEDARAVIETSPAAILTLKADGTIELANKAAQRLLCLDSGSAPGRNIRDYLPLLADMLKTHRTPSVRTMVEGRGRRGNGEMFFAHMWLSTYSTPAGGKLAAVVADVSEQVRDREELGLRQLLMNSHIIAGAVSHEVRNLAAAAGALHDNIARSCRVTGSEDFIALGHLIEGMRKLCSSEIPVDNEQSLTGVDLNALFKELDIILQTGAEDSRVELRWDIAENLPRVRAHHSGLLQVLLNLTQNSRRALRGKRNAYVTIAAYPVPGSVLVIVADNGPGITSPEVLFQPFQAGAESSGLGLYVSRAIIRSYGGELRYSKRTFESCFHIELQAMAAMEVTAIA